MPAASRTKPFLRKVFYLITALPIPTMSFRSRCWRALVRSFCRAWSARSSTVIGPYDKTLNAISVADRRAWAATVLDQLREVLHEHDDVVIFAGQRYREFLLDDLRLICRRVDLPLAGLGIGQQLQWFTQRQPR